MMLSSLQTNLQGNGALTTSDSEGIRLVISPDTDAYSNAQLDDYHTIRRRDFLWTPPLRMRIDARASHSNPVGTLGFGFWNDPFTLTIGQAGAARRLPSSPQVAWFFYGSPPNDLSFTKGISGSGWKAMTMNSPPLPSLLLLPAAALGIALTRFPYLRAPIIRASKNTIQTAEHSIDLDLATWHRYEIVWDRASLEFKVDETPILKTLISPQSPLGFVVWIDNQFAIATEEDGLSFGILPFLETQWLEVAELSIKQGL